MNEHDDLREQLEALVPEAPDTDFTVGARHHARKARRRRGAALVSAVAVAAVAVGVPLSMRDRDRSLVATTPDRTELACPAGFDASPGSLPANPVRARLCTSFGLTDGVLESGADQVAALADAAPVSEDQCIDNVGGTSWALVFEYGDGTTKTISAASSCSQIFLGDGDKRLDTGEVQAKYVDLLAAQRAGQTPPGSDREVSCDQAGPNTPLIGELALTSAVVCRFDARTEEVTPRELTDAELATVNADFNARAEIPTMMPSCVAEDIGYSVVGTNAWGDLVVMGGYCLGFMVGDLTWEPGPEVSGLFPK